MNFWKATGIRVLRTMAQCALGLMTSTMLLTEIDVPLIINATLFAGLYSFLNAVITGLPEVPEDKNV